MKPRSYLATVCVSIFCFRVVDLLSMYNLSIRLVHPLATLCIASNLRRDLQLQLTVFRSAYTVGRDLRSCTTLEIPKIGPLLLIFSSLQTRSIFHVTIADKILGRLHAVLYTEVTRQSPMVPQILFRLPVRPEPVKGLLM